jgi:hypothetical protein
MGPKRSKTELLDAAKRDKRARERRNDAMKKAGISRRKAQKLLAGTQGARRRLRQASGAMKAANDPDKD